MSTEQTQQPNLDVDLRQLAAKAGPYPPVAYRFVREGLSRTVEVIHSQESTEADRHVSGQQLCMGLREYAIERYGLLAPVVLRSWHVHRTDDFGRIVFAMIDAGLLSKTPQDSFDDFRGVFDFSEAFGRDRLVNAMQHR
ncbi:MAG: hypothetical protein K8R92_09230 [Planctomycetes bacterium]|nr:hypothetical protein [Planctomycetota bacterium]